MKAFVSGQLDEKEEVRELFIQLKNLGFEITHDWTRTDNIIDKLDNRVECGQRAAKDITGVVDSDVYILVANNEKCGKGMYAELGAALALNETTGKPDIYIVGAMKNLSIFYLHPSVQLFKTTQDLIDHLNGKFI